MRIVPVKSSVKIVIATSLSIWMSGPIVAADPSSSPPPDPAREARIQRIVEGLLPPVVIKEQPAPGIKLQDMLSTARIPGVSIATIHDGAIDWARGYGITNFGGPPVTPVTLFYAPALGRLIVALAVLQLVDKGKLDLDADVNQYLKTWKLPENSFTDQAKVTLRHLLSNTAGTPIPGFGGYAPGMPLPTLLQVLEGAKPANNVPMRIDTIPGTRWRYSSGGYAVIQQLLEDVTGQPFAKYAQEKVLAPIGMTRTTFEQRLPETQPSDVAMPFGARGQPIRGGPQAFPVLAASGFWTTPSDLARCVIEVQRARAGRSSTAISPAMVKQLLAPGLAPRPPIGEGVEQQGLGTGVGGKPERRFFALNSTYAGYSSMYVAYESGDGVVIMTNSAIGFSIARPILRAVSREYGWPDFQPTERSVSSVPDVATYDKFVGTYEMSSGGAIRIHRVGDKLMLAEQPGGDAEMFPQSSMQFFTKTVDLEFLFNADADGEIVDGIIQGRDSQITITKLKETSVDPSLFDNYVGRYQFSSGRIVAVMRDGDRLLVQLPNQQRVELAPLNEREFFTKRIYATATFETDEQGRAQIQWFEKNEKAIAKRID